MTEVPVAALSVKLLRDAAEFFVSVGGQNPDLAAQMDDNAEVYRQVADVLDVDPEYRLEVEDPAADRPTMAQLGAKLLDDAATFFRNVGVQNPALVDQMEDNAAVFRAAADVLRRDPTATLPED